MSGTTSRTLTRSQTSFVVEALEDRVVPSAELSLQFSLDSALPGEQVTAEVRYSPGEAPDESESSFADRIGPSLFTVDVGLANPSGGLFIGDTFEVFGQHDGQAAIDDGEILYFDSISSAQGDSGDPTGRIHHATELLDGSVVYVGQSAGSVTVDQPTYWFAPDTPNAQRTVTGGVDSGSLRAASANGTVVGTNAGLSAAYYPSMKEAHSGTGAAY